MLNQIVLVGRLTRDITVNKSDKGNNSILPILEEDDKEIL